MGDGMGIPNDGFAAFLKQKVEKKRDIVELRHYTKMIDINKDSYISAPDLAACINNLNNAAFWRNQGEAVATSTFGNKTQPFPKTANLSIEKTKIVLKQIKDALQLKQLSFQSAFNSFDTNKDNMVSFSEFQAGIQKICPISQPILE